MTSSFSEVSRAKPTRPKRKEKSTKPKSTEHKTKKHTDVVAQLREKLAQKENASFSKARYSLASEPEASNELGSRKKACLSSQNVDRRMVLGTIGGGNAPPNPPRCTTGKKAHCSSAAAAAVKPVEPLPRVQSDNETSMCAQMECSPPAAVATVTNTDRDIARRICECLKPTIYFSSSDNLKRIKEDLRRNLMLNDSRMYKELTSYLAKSEVPSYTHLDSKLSSGEESECTEEEEEEEEEGSEATVYYSPSLAVVFGSEDATAPPPPSFLPPLSDAVALQIEVESTSDADMTTGEATQHPIHSDGCVADAKPSSCHSEKHRLDFLDLLDAASVTKTSPVDQPKSRDSSDWLMSAERPRLFPRKLY